jgi:biotin carboxyl carrier protein
MKMELVLSAPFDGVVETVKIKVGDQVTEGTVLAAIRQGE